LERQPFSFQGDHFTLEETTFLPPPVQQPRPPIWVAGWWPNKPPLRRAARWDGIFSELVLGGLPSPDELREILAYIHEHRKSSAPFDAVLGGHTETNPSRAAEAVGPYGEAGLSWWLEKIEPGRLNSVPGTLERIKQARRAFDQHLTGTVAEIDPFGILQSETPVIGSISPIVGRVSINRTFMAVPDSQQPRRTQASGGTLSDSDIDPGKHRNAVAGESIHAEASLQQAPGRQQRLGARCTVAREAAAAPTGRKRISASRRVRPSMSSPGRATTSSPG
jgi:hypothetical protein